MTNDVKIPFNDVFFYGLTLKSREISDVRNDIFANILMRYLRTLTPAHNRLYRIVNDDKYEYNYSFIPSRPLSWRVLKNRRVIEQIDMMSGGKYCLTCYDDQGRELKRVIYDSSHKWQKTNYYSTIAGDNIVCSIVPKENNGQTVILRYDTRKIYPVTMYPCPDASCDEVLSRVLRRVPEPELVALTNYGVLYFATEDTLNIYTQILKEEEDRYQEETKPPVYTTDEDVAKGFCFKRESFSEQAAPATFDLLGAEELTEDNISGFFADSVDAPAIALADEEEQNGKDEDALLGYTEDITDVGEPLTDDKSGVELLIDLPNDPESAIAEVIKVIADRTDVRLDSEEILGSSADASDTTQDAEDITENVTADVPVELEPSVDIEQRGYSIGEGLLFSDPLSVSDSSEIDDYVSSLIDSLLISAKAAVKEYRVGSEENFEDTPDEQSAECDTSNETSTEAIAESYLAVNEPASVIESNGCNYYYYGRLDEDGNRTGRGKTLMESGNTAYDGEYLDDMRDGEGSFYYKDGSLCYWGKWTKNMRNGFGIGISSESGVAHIGEWQDNRPVGVGIRFDRNGEFLYIDSNCELTNGGMRITSLSSESITVEYWDEKTLRTIKKVITPEDLLKDL